MTETASRNATRNPESQGWPIPRLLQDLSEGRSNVIVAGGKQEARQVNFGFMGGAYGLQK